MRSFLAVLVLTPAALCAQARPNGPLQQATQLDLDGQTVQARALIQSVIDTSTAPAGRAAAQRALAMSYAFDGDCANTVRMEEQVIAYWKTREEAEPQNAFYQQGEMANEAARVCIDAGQLDIAERYYRLGTRLGLAEPMPKTHTTSLWDFRLAHALARLAARRGDKQLAAQEVAKARRALDSDSTMRVAQERFYPYLTGYVALYTNDLVTAEADFTRALGYPQNQNDPFMNTLLAMTYEREGHAEKAKALYQKAYNLATAHNPPSAYVRPLARKKLGL